LIFNGGPSGVAICKDLDFPGYIKDYGKAAVLVLFVPAWDFIKDDWLHSRMAVFKGCGKMDFPVVRTAREGRLNY
jgi:apolipoprotein N-acyltransferase